MQQEQVYPENLNQEFDIEQLEQRVEFGLCGGGSGGGDTGSGGDTGGGSGGSGDPQCPHPEACGSDAAN